jgi:hypothetical protein
MFGAGEDDEQAASAPYVSRPSRPWPPGLEGPYQTFDVLDIHEEPTCEAQGRQITAGDKPADARRRECEDAGDLAKGQEPARGRIGRGWNTWASLTRFAWVDGHECPIR